MSVINNFFQKYPERRVGMQIISAKGNVMQVTGTYGLGSINVQEKFLCGRIILKTQLDRSHVYDQLRQNKMILL